MTEQPTDLYFQHDLADQLDSIDFAEPANGDLVISTQQVQTKILSKVLDFLSQNAGQLPDKQAVLDIVSKAIDAAFTALNKPFVTGLLKPIVKTQILTIVSNVYDNLFSNRTEV